MKIKLLLLSLIASSFCIAQDISKKKIEKWTEDYSAKAVENLSDFLSIPNNGLDPIQIQNNLNWSKSTFEDLGFTVTEIISQGIPVLLAEKKLAPNLPTVLFYLQIDGQPVDSAQWDQENPYIAVFKEKNKFGAWELTDLKEKKWDKESYIFARSASDSKGPAMSLISAFQILNEKSIALKYNIKVLLDFQEEVGSPTLPEMVVNNKDLLQADYLFIMDGARHLSNKPTLTFGARGIATAKWRVFGPKVPLHSGQYGNYAPNPVFDAAKVIGQLKDASGKVTLEGFYDGIDISKKDQEFLNAIEENEIATNKRLGISKRDAIGAGYQEALQYPSLNIRGIKAAWVGAQVRTIIPAEVIVEIDMRLVPESDGKTLMESLKKRIQEEGYFLVDSLPTDQQRALYPKLANFTYKLGSKPFRTPMDGPIADLLSTSMKKIFGDEFILMRTTGGSQPIAPFISTLNIPAVSIRIPNPDNNIHSPNENIKIGNYLEGIMTCLSILNTCIEGS